MGFFPSIHPIKVTVPEILSMSFNSCHSAAHGSDWHMHKEHQQIWCLQSKILSNHGPSCPQMFLHGYQYVSNSFHDPGSHLSRVPYLCFPRLNLSFKTLSPISFLYRTGHQEPPSSLLPLCRSFKFSASTSSGLIASFSLLPSSNPSAILQSQSQTTMPLRKLPMCLLPPQLEKRTWLAPGVLTSFPVRKTHPSIFHPRAQLSSARALHALPGFYPFAHAVPALEVSLPFSSRDLLQYVSFWMLISSPASGSPSRCLQFPALAGPHPSRPLLGHLAALMILE